MPAIHPLTRRHALRLLSGAALAAVAGVRLAGAAAAGVRWCRRDPQILVGGHVANVYVSSYNDILDSGTGPTRVVVTVPTGYAATAQVLDQDDGFGYGYAVTFQESAKLGLTRGGAINVGVQVYVPSSKTALPVKVELADAAGTFVGAQQGKVNAWTKVGGAI